MQQLQDEYQDYVLSLHDQLIDQNPQDLCFDDRINPEGELCQINQARVSIEPDLSYTIVEEALDDSKSLVADQGISTEFSVRDLEQRP